VRVEVILEESPTCPRCALLRPLLRRLCDELGVPFFEVVVDTEAVAAYAQDARSRTLSGEWVEAFGTPRQRELYRRHRRVFEALASGAAVPNVRIRWHDGARTREIVIAGFPAGAEGSEEAIARYLANLRSLIRALRSA